MKKGFTGFMFVVVALLFVFFFDSSAFALKNVCPDCKLLQENMDLTECPGCGKIINKCLICGTVNPMKNDNCSECHASLAESRVMRTIDLETREELRLGESDRAKIEVELGQIKNQIETGELTAEIAARRIELLTKMEWWSQANHRAIEFAEQFSDTKQNILVKKCRVKSLRRLGFLALEDDEYVIANEYLKTALKLDPEDKKTANLLKASQNEIDKK